MYQVKDAISVFRDYLYHIMLHSLITASATFLFAILQVKEPEWFRKLTGKGLDRRVEMSITLRRGQCQSHFITTFRNRKNNY
jgi:hypothetical protein